MRVSSEAQAEAGSFAPTTQPAAIPWLLRRVMRQLECGRLTVILPSGRRISHVGVQPGPHGIMQVHDNRAFRRLLTRGDVGFSEGYVAGDWSSPDLTALIAMAAEKNARRDRTREGCWPVRLWRRLGHALKLNSLRGSRRNIAFHYDLGNDFYRLWLDRSMTYSSACWIAPGQSLEAAQQDKLDRIAKLLSLRGDDEVLEIGCGWGALAVHLAQRCGRVAGLTLSTEQLAYARRRAVYAGMSDRIDFRLQDYREEVGRYDRIVSIEMLEAVGEAYCSRRSRFAKIASMPTSARRISSSVIFFRVACCRRRPFSRTRLRGRDSPLRIPKPSAGAMPTRSRNGVVVSMPLGRKSCGRASTPTSVGCGTTI